MPGFAELALILLAAGEGRRFGGAKLETEFDGKMLGLHTAKMLASLGFGQMVAVSNSQNERLNPALADLGYNVILNPDPTSGQSRSLALGIAAIDASKAAGGLIALADMPFVDAAHMQKLEEAFRGAAMETAICSVLDYVRMPPAIFPTPQWQMLSQMSGDRGAKSLLADAIPINGSAEILADVDRPEDLPHQG